jgi:hypothetical protein
MPAGPAVQGDNEGQQKNKRTNVVKTASVLHDKNSQLIRHVIAGDFITLVSIETPNKTPQVSKLRVLQIPNMGWMGIKTQMLTFLGDQTGRNRT